VRSEEWREGVYIVVEEESVELTTRGIYGINGFFRIQMLPGWIIYNNTIKSHLFISKRIE
jgi:hypothetical protein